jgi:ribokinase
MGGFGMILIFGSINVDLVARVDQIARPGETVLSPGYEVFYGGKGANQAVAAARSAPSGTSVSMCGAVGKDTFGDGCRANFATEGVDASLLQVVDAPTGCAFISVDARGENAITVASGANHALDAGKVDPKALNDVRVAVLQMEVPLVENLRIARRLRSTEAIVILNFAPARADLPGDELGELLGLIDYLVVNEHEASTLHDALPRSHVDDSTLAEHLRVSVIVTLGAKGVELHAPEQEVWRCDAGSVEVIDTTGAGDTFVGILASGLDADWPIRASIKRAAVGASLSCTKLGAQAAMPLLVDLNETSDVWAV